MDNPHLPILWKASEYGCLGLCPRQMGDSVSVGCFRPWPFALGSESWRIVSLGRRRDSATLDCQPQKRDKKTRMTNRITITLGLAAAVLLGSLSIDSASAGKHVSPRTGWYKVNTSQGSSFYKSNGIRVINHSKRRIGDRSWRRTVGVYIGVILKCPPLPVVSGVLNTTKTAKGKPAGQLGHPSPLKTNATFSLRRTIRRGLGGSSMTARITGRFRSPTRVTGTIVLSNIIAPFHTSCPPHKIAFSGHFLFRSV